MTKLLAPHITKLLLSDVRTILNKLELDNELIEPILVSYEKFDKLSAMYLARKFKINGALAEKIMRALNSYKSAIVD